jgi:hypothetical protein
MTKRNPIKTPSLPPKASEAPTTQRRSINPSALIASGKPEAPAESGEIVTVMIPRDFSLTLDGSHHQVHYKAGTDEMPIEHANHWYAKANGVEIYTKGRKD